jgi:hypothetical protein
MFSVLCHNYNLGNLLHLTYLTYAVLEKNIVLHVIEITISRVANDLNRGSLSNSDMVFMYVKHPKLRVYEHIGYHQSKLIIRLEDAMVRKPW